MIKKIDIKKLEKSQVEIGGEISSEDFAKYEKKALKHLGGHLELPGFRKGHVPENILVKNIPEIRILEEVAEIAMTDIYPQILEENKIDAIGRPEIIITKLARGNPLGFKIITAVIPEIKLPDYKKIAKKAEKLGEVKAEEEREAREKRRIKIIEDIINESKIDLPKILVDAELDKMLYRLKSDIQNIGFKFEDYLKKIEKSEADIRKEWEKEAEKRSKLQLMVNKIAENEKIEPGKEEVEHELAHLLEHYKDADKIRARAYIESILTTEKVFKFLENQ